MATLDDIQFDTDYSEASTHFLLLYDHFLDQTGPSVAFKLSYAHLLTFIRRFDNLFECQQHVSTNLAKMITLFVSQNKLLNWNSTNNIYPNVLKVFIFCNTFQGYHSMINWRGCYHKKILKVFWVDKLEFHLLRARLDQIETIRDKFPEDNDLREQFMADGERIANALGGSFAQWATRLSQEAT